MKIHADDCPALCGHGPQGMNTCGHACTCTAAADLAELVVAAEAVTFQCLRDVDNDRLIAALKPFREEKPAARFPCEPIP